MLLSDKGRHYSLGEVIGSRAHWPGSGDHSVVDPQSIGALQRSQALGMEHYLNEKRLAE